jgi:hypothetical protein
MRYSLALLLLLTACSNPTGPGHDPVLLVRNRDVGQTITFTWRDGQGITGTDVISTTGDFCERFTARPDSAYFEFVRADSTGGWHTYTAPWFRPDSFPSWTVDIYPIQGQHQISAKDTTSVPC